MTGTTPPGVTGEQATARWVRDMFGRVSGRYDLLNHLLSFNLDRRWRARTVDRVAPVLARENARVLDLCCGTGDLLFALSAKGKRPVMGSDFCHPMLLEARRKAASRALAAPLFEADALALPLRDAAFDLITIAFGLRNFANYRKGLQELLRVLKPGGLAAILEFSQPPGRAFRTLYGFFSRHVLPSIGGLVSGSREAYTYLPASISRFPGSEMLAREVRNTGFSRVEFERMTGGAVALHVAWK
ncbi:MAG: class I SAM-dependent methyltransferase [Bryobacterales bacterium]|nr:class I SAM-dependent methyltransferase [Bryobacterales bacterium]MBV9398123.1 class I SAM-dependent methyltransferase [Bryobacterales bacterium]